MSQRNNASKRIFLQFFFRGQLEHCFAVFSRFVLFQEKHGKNRSSPTVLNQNSSVWSHSKEKMKLYNRTLPFLNFDSITEILNFEVYQK